MFSSDNWFGAGVSQFYNGVATQSVRLDSASSAYLAFTPSSASSATDRKKVTHSVWVKRGVLGTDQTIYSGNRSGGGDYYLFRFSSDNKLTLILDVDAGGYGYDTSAVYRDVGAWYHVCVIIDTTQPTDTNRVKIYVNGVLQDKSTKYAGGHVPLDFSTYVMDGNEDEVGRFAFTDASYFDGYMAEFITTIGQDNTISEFGELKNGVWIPINYAGSYGGNGFRLQFNKTGIGTGSTTTIGADTSGNLNHWDSSGIDTEDCAMLDSVENNFPTINILHRGSSYSSTTTSEGNLSFKHSNLAHASAIATTALPKSGKWYWETLINSSSTNGSSVVGCVVSTYNNSNALSGAGAFFWINGFGIYGSTGANFGSTPSVTWDTTGSVTTFTANDIVGVAYDADNKNVEWYKNGVKIDYNVTDFDDDGNDLIPASSAYGNPANSGIVFNFGQDPSFAGGLTGANIGTEIPSEGAGVFKHAVPTGFKALCLANLPELTISPNADTQAENYFGVLTWSGDDNASRTIATGGSGVNGSVDFTPDWAWIKRRNGSSNGSDHLLLDIVRGVGSFNGLSSNGSRAEGLTEAGSTWANFGDISAFATDGFTVQKGSDPSHTLEGINQSGGTYVGWNWKAGGTAVSNTQGTINSSVSANTDAGFSIVSYTGTGANATVGHGLNQAPDWYVVKNRDATGNWVVYHKDLKASGFTAGQSFNYLNDTLGVTDSTVWNNTNPSSSVFNIGTSYQVNGSGNDLIAYCFAEIEGYSKFSSFIGNGVTSGDGTFVFLGLRPAFIMIKNISATADWVMVDSVRSTFNEVDDILAPDASSSESDFGTTNRNIDFLSNGFKIRSTSAGGTTALNTSGNTYIYMAFAENPFKYANAR